MPQGDDFLVHLVGNAKGKPTRLGRGERYALQGPSGCGKSTLLTALERTLTEEFGLRVTYIRQEDAAALDEETSTALELAWTREAQGTGKVEVERALKRKMGFPAELLEKPVKDLSGGWRQRLLVALAIIDDPDVLLTDETTNGMDLRGMALFEQALKTDFTNAIVVVVSHDRAFLEAIATEVLYFSGHVDVEGRTELGVARFPGDYPTFERIMRERAAATEAREDAADRQRAKAEAMVRRQQAQAGDDPNKARQARERKDKLERIGYYRDDGRRYRFNTLKKLDEKFLRLPQATSLASERRGPAKEMVFRLPQPSDVSDSGETLVRFDFVGMEYVGGAPKLLRDVTVSLTSGARVAVLGNNGQGKSCLLGCLADLPTCRVVVDASPRAAAAAPVGGVKPPTTSTSKGGKKHMPVGAATSALTPTVAGMSRSGRCRVVFVSQQHGDRLKHDHPNETPASLIATMLRGADATEHGARSFLGQFGLSGELGTRKIGVLSGGQLMRLALAVAFAKLGGDAPNVLVLDEPTLNMDANAIAALGRALRSFRGAVVVSSHDRKFVSSDLDVSEAWVVSNGRVVVGRFPLGVPGEDDVKPPGEWSPSDEEEEGGLDTYRDERRERLALVFDALGKDEEVVKV